MYMTDKRRVELAAIPLVFLHVAARVRDVYAMRGVDSSMLDEAARLLGAAAAAPLLTAGKQDAQASKLLRRCARMAKEIMGAKRGAEVLVVYCHTQHLLANLLDSERLVLFEGSDFDKGYQLLEAAIFESLDNAEDLERIDKSAQKSARKTLDTLKGWQA